MHLLQISANDHCDEEVHTHEECEKYEHHKEQGGKAIVLERNDRINNYNAYIYSD